MLAFNPLDSTSWLTVEKMMNKQFGVLHLGDSLRTVIRYYHEYKLNTLPVVDENENLIGVLPKKRLYKALLDGLGLDDPCNQYVVFDPVFVSPELTYDEISLVARINRSWVDYVVVVNSLNRVVGMIGTTEYLRECLNVIMTSSAMLESLFRANYEGIVIIDRDELILRINPAAERMFGFKLSEIKGIHLKDILPGITLSKTRCLGIKQTLKSVPVIVNQVPIMEGEVRIGTSIALLDISYAIQIAQELKIVKELQSTLSGVLGASSDGVFVSDMAGTVRFVNERASKLLTEPSANITGRPVDTFLHTKTPAHVAKTGTAEVDECIINGRNCIVSHIPIMQEVDNGREITGVVSTVYLENNVLTEEIARKWFSFNQQVLYYRNELEKRGVEISGFDNIVSKNPKFNRMKNDAQRIARSSSTVLLTGESGVGKGIFALAIHAASPRTKNPFIKVNCAAIPETLLESELFGYAPGSFTGASKKGKSGYFERANGGTIFLDEIGDMPLSIQVKILQVLQEKEFLRVGGQSIQGVDVRIIAATNRDLRERIAKGLFREDLFYRLNVIEFNLPALRERPEDIMILAESFIRKYNRILGSSIIGINPQAKNALESHDWPGNIRELENAIERAANYVWEGEIGIEDLPDQILQLVSEPIANVEPIRPVRSMNPSAYRSILGDVDKEMLLEALKKTNGNKSAAARLLKLSRSAFYEKLAKYRL